MWCSIYTPISSSEDFPPNQVILFWKLPNIRKSSQLDYDHIEKFKLLTKKITKCSRIWEKWPDTLLLWSKPPLEVLRKLWIRVPRVKPSITSCDPIYPRHTMQLPEPNNKFPDHCIHARTQPPTCNNSSQLWYLLA
jgi:hypothetical protein